MDLITHTLSGIAIGTVVGSFSGMGFRDKLKIIFLSGLGGLIPDMDALSLWSKFDGSIGRLFGLVHSGKEIYYSKFWYSHHAFFHSVMGGLLLALILWAILYMTESRRNTISLSSFFSSWKVQKLSIIGFVLGFLIHLLEDMPTPGCVWGGVNFFWPSKFYTGGTGDVWWWNNYDIFLIILTITFINTITLLSGKWFRHKAQWLTLSVFFLGFTLSLRQIKTRETDFNYTGHTTRYDEFELRSKEIQKEILGDRVYTIMVSFDNKIPIYF